MSAPKGAVEADREKRACDRGKTVHVGDLAVRIEYRNEQETGKAAKQGDSKHLEHDPDRFTGAAVRVGQMPLTPGTGGHL